MKQFRIDSYLNGLHENDLLVYELCIIICLLFVNIKNEGINIFRKAVKKHAGAEVGLSCGLRVACCGLRVLRFGIWDFRFGIENLDRMICGLRVASCGLRISSCGQKGHISYKRIQIYF